MNIIKRIKAAFTCKKLEREFEKLFKENPELTDLQCFVKAVYNLAKISQSAEADTAILRIYNENKRVYWVEDYDGWIRKDTFTKHMPVDIDLDKFTVTKNGVTAKLICISDDVDGIYNVYEGLYNE